jgi:hypothetical protein
MATLMRATILAAATAAAGLFAQPVHAAIVQPHSIVSDIGKSAKIVDVVRRRGGWGYRGGWGRRGWGHRGYWRRGGWGHRGWGHRGYWRRGWAHRGWGYRRGWYGGWPAYGYVGYGGYGCPSGYRWTYRWGCVPYYGYGYGYYAAPVVRFGIGIGGWW